MNYFNFKSIEILIACVKIRQTTINFRNRYHIIYLIDDPNLNLLNCEASRKQQITVAHQAYYYS